MIKEEWRLHKSLVGGFGSGLFPFIIFIFTSVGAFITPYIMGNINLSKILLMLHIASLMYGIFVGGFGRIGEHVMTRRLGQVNMLLQIPQNYPLSFKQVLAIFYIKDSLYYLIYSYIPLVAGVGLAAPSAGVSYRGVFVLGITMFLAFLMGLGLSFSVSALSLRSRKVAFLIVCLIFILILPVYPLNLIHVGHLITPLGYWINKKLGFLMISMVQSTILAAVGVTLMKEQFEIGQREYIESFLLTENKFGFIGELKTMVAKEWLELVRSGSLYPTLIGFSAHLLAVYFISWLFQTGLGIPLKFNVIFYSGFVGFMGVITYSFLTNLEHNEYLNVQPVSVGEVIKAKLSIYFLITSPTFGFLFLIGFLKGQISMIPMGLMVAASTNLFVVAVTAYLTGLWTNTMFFGAKTILRFTAIVVPPLTIIEIASMMLQHNPYLATQIIIITSMVLFLTAAFILTRLENKWKDTSFSYVSTGV
jgi:hypothetical protein